jgi:anti-sigma B factor antagonist
MEIQTKGYRGTTVVELGGEIDGNTAPEAQKVIAALIQRGVNILIDMTQTTYLSSAGLRMLLLLYREAHAQSARLVLVGLSDEIEDVMNSTGFLKFFRIAGTLEAAVSLLSR